MDIVSLKNSSKTPKYKQIIASIENAIQMRLLKKGDKLPSLNVLKEKHKVSRDTVLMAFNHLKTRGVLHAVSGKGYYVATDIVTTSLKIFLLFDELNAFKEDLYNAFLKQLGNHVEVDIFFHHFNRTVFDKLILDNAGNYSYYIIMPANLKDTKSTLTALPKEKVYILDQLPKDLSAFSAIYQNFKKDMYNGLLKAQTHLKKYNTFHLIYCKTKQPEGILNGFINFCKINNYTHTVSKNLENNTPKKGHLYVVLNDKDLITIIKQTQQHQLKIAKDIGIISFNDHLLKEVVQGGITTISTDFKLMGQQLANLILNNTHTKIENPSTLISRNSI